LWTDGQIDRRTDRQTGIKPIVPSGYTGRGLKKDIYSKGKSYPRLSCMQIIKEFIFAFGICIYKNTMCKH
jgi:hypothetical protein